MNDLPILSVHDTPLHIGIIMDGNGRWAQQKNLPRTAGHKEGVNAAREIIKKAGSVGIRYLTLYVFSTENWKRTQEEVGFLMNLLKSHLRAEFEFYKKEQVRLLHVGDAGALPDDVRKELESVQKDSADFTGMTLVLAINYGGQNEIIRGIHKMARDIGNPGATITEENFSSYFDVPEMPPVDLIIRTGGEKRLSNFLLWHSAYAELHFSDTLWPDYTPGQFCHAVGDFLKRSRRFGGIA
ncbi:MAG: polyprenyl diphosphate synthase [Spirochaetales bacterium]